MAHVEMSVDFLEGAELVAEVAALSIETDFLSVEGPAVLALVLVIGELHLLLQVEMVILLITQTQNGTK